MKRSVLRLQTGYHGCPSTQKASYAILTQPFSILIIITRLIMHLSSSLLGIFQKQSSYKKRCQFMGRRIEPKISVFDTKIIYSNSNLSNLFTVFFILFIILRIISMNEIQIMFKTVITLGVVLITIFAVVSKLVANTEMDILASLSKPSLSLLQNLPKQILPFKKLQIDTLNGFKLQYDGKTIIDGAFLSCYTPQPRINSDGDSFYKINTKLIDHCKQQKITNVSNNNGIISIDGVFDDCFGETFNVNASIWNQNLDIKVSCSSRSVSVWLYGEENDRYFGLGEQFSYLSLGERPYSMMVREKGVGRGDQPMSFLSELAYGKAGTYYSSYSPSPIWISSRKLAYFAKTYSYLIWHRNFLVSWSNTLQVKIISQPTYKLLVKQISLLNGYTLPTPQWVNKGAIVGLQGGSEKVRQVVDKLLKNGAKIAGVWLQDWVGKRMSLGYSRLWWNWELDSKLYPDWKQMRQEFEQKGIKLLIYMNPMLTDVTNKSYFQENYYSIANKNGYLVKNSNNQVFSTSAFSDFTAGLIDLYSSEARQFYKDLIKTAINSTGAMGMMVDFGQSYPLQPPYSVSSIRHNEYPVEWSKLVHQSLCQLSVQQSFFTFSRSSYLSSPPHTHSLWAGDQNMNYGRHNGLPSCLTAMLSSGLVGFANTHCDVGGYVYVSVAGVELAARDKQIMERWMGLGAFSPVFRTHQGNKPEKTMQVWDVEKEFAYFTTVYGILEGYRTEQAEISRKEGLPLVRPMFLQLENDSLSEIQDQYYFGDHILVAPILTEKSSIKTYLPNGKWLNLWSNQEQPGCDCWIEKQSHGLPIAYISSYYPQSTQIATKISSLPKYKNFETNDQL